MNLKVNLRLLSVFVTALFLFSCNGKDSVIEYQDESADAQIYSFALSATARNAVDSNCYKVLAKTKFLIDPENSRIYNPDSLPVGTVLRKFSAKVSFFSENRSINLVYADTTFKWNKTDSIDFSKNVRFEVTAPKGTSRSYTIDLRIHKLDPDSLKWKEKTSAKWNIATISKQKCVVKADETNGDKYFYYASTSTNTNKLRVFDSKNEVWVAAEQNIPNSILVESIHIFNNKFFAVNASGNTFSSTDGVNWMDNGNKNAHSILGVLPGKTTADDKLLVIVKDGTKFRFASTTDMLTLTPIANVSGAVANEVELSFPSVGFTTLTNYNRTDLSKNMLIITAGMDFSGKQRNLSWLIKDGDNGLQIASNKPVSALTESPNTTTFLYDSKLYAIAGKSLFISSTLGVKWESAPVKQVLPTTLDDASKTSVATGKDNFIWLFHTNSNGVSVWKGRLNRLIPRK